MLIARGLLGPVIERDWPANMPEIERLATEEAEQRGEAAYAPVGGGGAAVTAAERRDSVTPRT